MKSLRHYLFFVLLATATQASTTFVTKTSGNASGLEGAGAGTTTALPLSNADGGGTLNLTTVDCYNGGNPQTLGMDTDGMGIGNNKWGNGPQGWIFTVDQDVSFDGVGYNANGGAGEGVFIQSDVWIGAIVDAPGENWSFDSEAGAFSVRGGNGPLFDFTSAQLPIVPAGTEINIEHNSGNGGSNMTEFSLSVFGQAASSLTLAGFTYDPTDGAAEVSIVGAASTTYQLVEADNLAFSNSGQIPLTAATVGALSANGVTTDENGFATVQFNLGTSAGKGFLRAELLP